MQESMCYKGSQFERIQDACMMETKTTRTFARACASCLLPKPDALTVGPQTLNPKPRFRV